MLALLYSGESVFASSQALHTYNIYKGRYTLASSRPCIYLRCLCRSVRSSLRASLTAQHSTYSVRHLGGFVPFPYLFRLHYITALHLGMSEHLRPFVTSIRFATFRLTSSSSATRARVGSFHRFGSTAIRPHFVWRTLYFTHRTDFKPSKIVYLFVNGWLYCFMVRTW